MVNGKVSQHCADQRSTAPPLTPGPLCPLCPRCPLCPIPQGSPPSQSWYTPWLESTLAGVWGVTIIIIITITAITAISTRTTPSVRRPWASHPSESQVTGWCSFYTSYCRCQLQLPLHVRSLWLDVESNTWWCCNDWVSQRRYFKHSVSINPSSQRPESQIYEQNI